MVFELSSPDMRALIAKQTARDLMACNETTAMYGLTLTEQQALALAGARDEALRASGRVELGGGMLDKLIIAFCDSPYLSQTHYSDTLATLADIFYYFKNETAEALTDDELIAAMRALFDNPCQGDLDLLAHREMEQLARRVRGRYVQTDYDDDADMDAEDEDES